MHVAAEPPVRAEDHIPLVRHLLRRYSRRAQAFGVDLDDLAAEGYFALARCIAQFDPRKAKFSTLLWTSLTRAMEQALHRRKHRPLRQLPEALDPAAPAAVDRHVGPDVAELLHVLHPDDRRVVELRYGLHDGEERTLKEVAHLVNLTHQRVQQRLARALRRMREAAHARDPAAA